MLHNNVFILIMKKFCFSLVMACSLLVAVLFISCDKDEPIFSNEVSKSELTTPMFLFANTQSGAEAIQRGFSFYSFTDTKVAKGTFTMGTRATLKCEGIYDWSLETGKITIGSQSTTIALVNVLGVKAYGFGSTIYIPSSNTLAGNFRTEDIFIKLNYDKARLWRALEAAKNSATGVYMDEIE